MAGHVVTNNGVFTCKIVPFRQRYIPYSPIFPGPNCRSSQGRNCLSAAGGCEIYFKLLIKGDIWPYGESSTWLLQNQHSEGMFIKNMITIDPEGQRDAQFLTSLYEFFQAFCSDVDSRICYPCPQEVNSRDGWCTFYQFWSNHFGLLRSGKIHWFRS